MTFRFLVLTLFLAPTLAYCCADELRALAADSQSESRYLESALRGYKESDKAHLQSLAHRTAHAINSPEEQRRVIQRVRSSSSEISEQLQMMDRLGSNPEVQSVFALQVLRGTIKDLVWENGLGSRQQLKQLGVKPERLFNLHSADASKNALGEASSILPEKTFQQEVDSELRGKTGFSAEDFSSRSELHDIFADDVVDALRSGYKKRISKLPPEHPDLKRIKAQLDLFDLADRNGDFGFSLTRRTPDWLRGGDKAGDCTQVGAFNFWTQGAWNLTFDNFELQSQIGNRFFSRLLFIAGESEGKPAIWVHAVEFSPLARPDSGSELSDPKKQLASFKKTLEFLRDYSSRAGIEHVYVTGISNSYGYQNVLKSVLDASKGTSDGDLFQTRSVGFTLLNGLDSAHSILNKIEPTRSPVATVPIYLQGWRGPTSFRATHGVARSVDLGKSSDIVELGGLRVSRASIDELSRVASGKYNRFIEREKSELQSLSGKEWQSVYERASIAREPFQLVHEYTTSAENKISRVSNFFDPGAQDHLGRMAKALSKDLSHSVERLHQQLDLFPEEVDALRHTLSVVVRGARKQELDPDSRSFEEYLESRFPRLLRKWLDEAGIGMNRAQIDWLMANKPSDDLWNSAIESGEVEGLVEGWRENVRDGILSGEGLRKVSRSAATLPKYFDISFKTTMSMLERLENLDELQGPQMAAAARRFNPKFFDELKDYAQNRHYDPQLIQLVEENPEAIFDYYLEESRRAQQRDAVGSLSSPIDVFSLPKSSN